MCDVITNDSMFGIGEIKIFLLIIIQHCENPTKLIENILKASGKPYFGLVKKGVFSLQLLVN